MNFKIYFTIITHHSKTRQKKHLCRKLGPGEKEVKDLNLPPKEKKRALKISGSRFFPTQNTLTQATQAEPLLVRHNDLTLKQFSLVEYLGCLLDKTLSGEDMAVKVLTKVNARLRFLYIQGNYLNKRLRHRLCNAIITPY